MATIYHTEGLPKQLVKLYISNIDGVVLLEVCGKNKKDVSWKTMTYHLKADVRFQVTQSPYALCVSVLYMSLQQ